MNVIVPAVDSILMELAEIMELNLFQDFLYLRNKANELSDMAILAHEKISLLGTSSGHALNSAEEKMIIDAAFDTLNDMDKMLGNIKAIIGVLINAVYLMP